MGRRPAAKHVVVNSKQRPEIGALVERLAGTACSCGGEAGAQLRIAQEASQGTRQGFRVTGRNEQGGLPVGDKLGGSSHGRRGDGDARSHSFKDDIRGPFAM